MAEYSSEILDINKKIITVSHLHKQYSGIIAIDDISFSVSEGEIFGIIGPNGAGKTTTVECISGLRNPDSGLINVFGFDPKHQRNEIRKRVGVQLQESSIPPRLKVAETLDLFASFYPDSQNPKTLLDSLGIWEKRNTRYKQLSGGQKQKFSIALALIGNPEIAILDELTTGLDPDARREVWQLIEYVRKQGVTIILVTHYMVEAEWLCDRVAVINQGKVVALDTPTSLSSNFGGVTQLQFIPSRPVDEHVLKSIPGILTIEYKGRKIIVKGTGDLISETAYALLEIGVKIKDLSVKNSNLEDAFMTLTHTSNKQVTKKEMNNNENYK